MTYYESYFIEVSLKKGNRTTRLLVSPCSIDAIWEKNNTSSVIIISGYAHEVRESLEEIERLLADFIAPVNAADFIVPVKEKEEYEEKMRKLLSSSIENLCLSQRPERCLMYKGINTVGKLIKESRQSLLKIRHFGVTSLSDVEDALNQLGLSLRKEEQ